MTITALPLVRSLEHRDFVAQLAAAIDSGLQPRGNMIIDAEGAYCQQMQEGTAASSLDDMQTAIDAAQSTADAAAAAATALALLNTGTSHVVDEAIGVTAAGPVNHYLTKTSAGAYTMAAPGAANIRRRLVSTTAFAHVVTVTDLIDDGTTGGPKDTATFAAFDGASIDFISTPELKWAVVSKNNVTVAGS
jgi:hypothetical protein